jgi:branched-chain amino acid transport system permease protein
MNLDWLSQYTVTVLILIVTTVGLALLLHLQMGLAGIGNFGIVGFYGVGMYGFGMFLKHMPWPEAWAGASGGIEPLLPFLISLAFGTVVAGLAGLLVGWLVVSLDADGILLGTLGFATIVYGLSQTNRDWTGGAEGMGITVYPYALGSQKRNALLWLLITAVVVALILYYVIRIHRSPYGRLLIATGQNEALARSLGKHTFRAKLLMFATGSAGMGLLGAMYAVMLQYIRPVELLITVTLAAMVGLVVGGQARAWGAVVGVILVGVLFELVFMVWIPFPLSWRKANLPVIRQMLYGATLILVLMSRPLGILGRMRRDKTVRRPGRA